MATFFYYSSSSFSFCVFFVSCRLRKDKHREKKKLHLELCMSYDYLTIIDADLLSICNIRYRKHPHTRRILNL
jgi:hypothetical protein